MRTSPSWCTAAKQELIDGPLMRPVPRPRACPMEPNMRPLDHLPLTGKPDAPALDVPRLGTLSFAELETRTGRLAAWIVGQGFAPGSRIACWLPKGALTAI